MSNVEKRKPQVKDETHMGCKIKKPRNKTLGFGSASSPALMQSERENLHPDVVGITAGYFIYIFRHKKS
jgi:hypothetical protein